MSFLSILLPVSAQDRKFPAAKIRRGQQAVPVKFIEEIELKRDVQHYSVQVTQVSPVKIPFNSSRFDGIEHSLPLQFKYAQLLNRNVESIVNLTLFDF
ncbi:MAG: hypothetical protein H7258_00020, partial [Ferruginibacter sp.]|nr:hypothetical protein [Ferruginibacter sp.]